MSLSDLKSLFRKNLKVVPGGPAVGTPGANRTAGVLAALDALAEAQADAQASAYTNAYPLVCERADGTTNFTFTTLHEAVAWTNGGGAGSTTYVNRPLQVQTFVTLAAGTVLDVQHQPIDVADWVIRLGPGAAIRNNRLLYAGRLAPFDPTADPTTNVCTVQGGTVACRLNFQSSPAATVILDEVVVTDFGQSAVPGITGGHLATTPEADAKVELRGGARFTPDYPPHPNTTVTVVPGGGAGGLATRDPFDVDTAKRRQVVDTGAAAYPETDAAYYGCEFVDEVYGPTKPALYRCLPSAPATAGATAWKWFRIAIQ